MIETDRMRVKEGEGDAHTEEKHLHRARSPPDTSKHTRTYIQGSTGSFISARKQLLLRLRVCQTGLKIPLKTEVSAL